MEHTERGTILFDYGDLIRINRLVRDRIDFEAFKRWYDRLSTAEQSALISVLYQFTVQAGFDDDICNAAITDAELSPMDPIVHRAQSFHTPHGHIDIQGLYQWAVQIEGGDRSTVFRYFVYLFGHAEGKVYKGCHGTTRCNHWWHGDLPAEEEVASAPAGHLFHRPAWPAF